jgi:transposase InsO family protein
MKTAQKVLKVKVGLLELAKQLGNVSQARKLMGDSRDSCFRFQELYEHGGEAAVQELSRRTPNLKNRVAPEGEEAGVASALEQPAGGPLRAAKELAKRGLPISPAGVRCVWERQGREKLTKRLRALEAKVARERHSLTAAQLAALEKAKIEQQAQGKFVSEWPGSCGAQDPFSVGTLKGVGRIYQQTFIDTYSKVAFAKLYDRKTPRTAADLLNDQVVPCFETPEGPLSRVLTERGTESWGSLDHQEDELYLAGENIDHTRTKVTSPQTTGICERFHKTILNEFYRLVFRKKLSSGRDELQAELQGWLREYNEERPHQGRWCYGKTPMQTFVATIPLAKEKLLAA